MPAAFTLVSSPTRRRNVSQLLDQGFTDEQLAYADQMTLRKEGRKIEADIIKKVTAADGSDPTVVQASYRIVPHRPTPSSIPKKLSADEALVLLFNTNMTRAAYQEVRETSTSPTSSRRTTSYWMPRSDAIRLELLSTTVALLSPCSSWLTTRRQGCARSRRRSSNRRQLKAP